MSADTMQTRGGRVRAHLVAAALQMRRGQWGRVGWHLRGIFREVRM
jgi:hypothetical protein